MSVHAVAHFHQREPERFDPALTAYVRLPYRSRMVIKRDNKLTVMLSSDEKVLLEGLSELDGLTASDYLRTLIRREGAARLPERTMLKPRRAKSPK